MARNAGIRSKLNSYFAIGLGAEAANPLEMARAYSTFANNGNRIDGSILGNEPRAITQIGKNKNAVVTHRVPAVGALQAFQPRLGDVVHAQVAVQCGGEGPGPATGVVDGECNAQRMGREAHRQLGVEGMRPDRARGLVVVQRKHQGVGLAAGASRLDPPSDVAHEAMLG